MKTVALALLLAVAAPGELEVQCVKGMCQVPQKDLERIFAEHQAMVNELVRAIGAAKTQCTARNV